MGQVIGLLLILFLYLLYLFVVWYVSYYLILLGAPIFIGFIVRNYLQTLWAETIKGKGADEETKPPEPAYKHYFFDKVWRDYRLALHKSWERNLLDANRLLGFGKGCFKGEVALLAWPLGIIFFIVLVVGAIGAAGFYFFFVVIHAVVVTFCAAMTMGLAWLLRLLEYGQMGWNQITLKCPHGNCYNRISMPVYQCPDCGQEHKRLIPGSYGLLRRRCQCNSALVTLFLLGRNQLPSYCPHCRGPLNEAIGVVRNLHVPIIGGPAVGKSTFLMANISDLYQRQLKGEIRLEFPEKKDETTFVNSYRDFSSGIGLNKTAAQSPDAFQVKITDPTGNSGLLYVYDPAGELYQQMDTLRRHEYFSYSHGILFLLDPFSLPEVKIDFESELASAGNQVKPSFEEPQEVYARMIATFRQHSQVKNVFGKVPLAVVVTKADAFHLDRQIESTVPPESPPGSRLETIREAVRGKSGTPESERIRHWLVEHGGGNLVRTLEQDFQNIRYFYCSALGRMPDGRTQSFTPQKALDPLAWLLDHYRLKLNRTGLKIVPRKAKTAAWFSSPPVIKLPRKTHYQVIILSLWALLVLGLAIFGASSLRILSFGIPSFTKFGTEASPSQSPRTLTAAELALVEKELRSLIVDWIESLKKGHFGKHVSYYADEYVRLKKTDREGYRLEIERNFAPFNRQIDLQYEILTITPDEFGLSARAVLTRTWRFEGDNACQFGSVKETVVLKKINSQWQIAQKFAPKVNNPCLPSIPLAAEK